MDNFNVKLGNRILKLRTERGMSREKLAELAEMSDKYLYEVEKGKKSISAFLLHNLAQTLEVSVDYLIFGDNGSGTEKMKFEKILSLLKSFDVNELKRLEIIIREIAEISNTSFHKRY